MPTQPEKTIPAIKKGTLSVYPPSPDPTIGSYHCSIEQYTESHIQHTFQNAGIDRTKGI